MISAAQLDMYAFKETYRLNFSMSYLKQFAVYIIQIENLVERVQGACQIVAIQKMSSAIFIITAWYLVQNPEPCNKGINLISDSVCNMLGIALKIVYVSDILYQAMYYNRTCRYEQSLRCLQRAQERMSVRSVMYYGNVNVEMYRRAMTGVSLSDKMRKAVVSDILLVSEYTYIVH
jgi:hypothetical protein